jgi:multiple sugar transport system substrate-binding protein
MKKLVVFAVLVALVGVFVVFADSTTYPAYPAYTGPAATITMWAWTSNENYSIDAFEKVYPNIHVVWSNFGVDYTKILTSTAAGKGLPDVIMSEYTYGPQFAEYGSFQPINKWVPKSLYDAFFPEYSLKWTSLDGQIYGTPQDSGAIVMLYRKDIFEKYGLTVPTTWQEFAQDAEKLHSENPDIAFTTIPNNWVIWPVGMVWQAGGRMFDYANGKWYVDFTNPTAMKVFDYWNNLLQEGAVKFDTWWTADWYKEIDQGKLAVIISGAWSPEWVSLNSPSTSGKWRVALLPQWDPNNPHNGEMGGSGFYVSSQSKYPEAAALFVLWLNSNPQSLEYLNQKSQLAALVSNVFTTDVAPSLENVEYPYFGGQKIVPVVLEANNQVNTAFVWLPVMDYVQSSMETEFQKVIDGKESLVDAIPNWQNAVVAFMKRQGFNNLVVGQLPK